MVTFYNKKLKNVRWLLRNMAKPLKNTHMPTVLCFTIREEDCFLKTRKSILVQSSLCKIGEVKSTATEGSSTSKLVPMVV